MNRGFMSQNVGISGAWGGRTFRPIPIHLGQDQMPQGKGPEGQGPKPAERAPQAQGPMTPQDQAKEMVRADRREDRICTMLQHFNEVAAGSPDEADIRARIFWSFIRAQAQRTNSTEDDVASTVQQRCINLKFPPKPPAAKPLGPPGQQGFHGKTQLSFQEAKELSDVLTVVLTPLTPEEAAKELTREECLRNIVQADGFPIVERLQERLKDFIAAGNQSATFEISKGEAMVTGHAVECAAAIGRAKTIRTVATAGGVAAGGAGLLWLVGLL